MLDEKIEFTDYSEHPERRLKLNDKEFLESLSGMNRAMFIVARGYAFDERGNFDEKRGLEGLANWCGFGDGESALKKATGEDNWNKYIKKKKKLFEKKLYLTGKEETSFKVMSYERILADAFEAGPLKTFLLRCDRDFYENCEFTNTGKQKNNRYTLKYRETPNTNPDNIRKAQGPNNYNRIIDSALKLTACYLLSRSGGSEYAYINQTDLVNWGTVTRGTLPKLSFKGELLYDKINYDQAITVKMPAAWAEHFAVVEENDVSYEDRGKLVYWADWGCSTLSFISDGL